MNTPNAFEALLATVGQLAPAASFSLAEAQRWFKPKRLKAGSSLFRPGDHCRSVAFLASGLLRNYMVDKDGNDSTKFFYRPNLFVLPYTDIIRNKPARFGCEALEESLVLCCDWDRIEQRATTDIAWLMIIRRLADAMLIHKIDRELAFMTMTGTERYQAFLQDFPGLEDRVRQYHIASYLGLNPVSLSRIRGGLTDVNDSLKILP